MAETTSDGFTWVEKEITRKGKTHKQWFRVKAKGAPASPAAKLVASAPAAPAKSPTVLEATGGKPRGKESVADSAQAVRLADQVLAKVFGHDLPATGPGSLQRAKDGRLTFEQKQVISRNDEPAMLAAQKEFRTQVGAAQKLGWTPSSRGQEGGPVYEHSFVREEGGRRLELIFQNNYSKRDGTSTFLTHFVSEVPKASKPVSIEMD